MQNGAHNAPFGSHFGDFFMTFLRCAVYVIFENSPAIIIDLQVWESQKVSYFPLFFEDTFQDGFGEHVFMILLIF